MTKTKNLLPDPWRLLFPAQPDLAADSPLYTRLVQYAASPYRQMPTDALERWDIDQTTGEFTAQLAENMTVTARFQLLGTHDRHSFLWANNNPSIDPQRATLAAQTRQALQQDAPALAQPDQLDIGQRDAATLLSFGAEAAQADMTFQGVSGDTTVFMALIDPQQDKPAKRSFLSRLTGADKSHAFDLSNLLQPITNQWQQNLLTPDALLALEPDLTAAKALFDAEKFDACAAAIADIKTCLGPYAADQEPTGWVFFCAALCALETGDTAAAEEALNTTRRAIIPPPRVRTLLAGARCGNWSESRTIGAYIADPTAFVTLATPAEQEIARQAIATALTDRGAVADDPLSVLKAANIDRHTTARRAWDVAEAAKAHRTETHILCDADHAAEEENAQNHRHMLLRWYNPHRSPSAASLSSDPDEDPERCENIEVIAQSDDHATIIAIYAAAWSDSTKDRYRYELHRRPIPLSEDICWRISEVWSLWDSGDIRLE